MLVCKTAQSYQFSAICRSTIKWQMDYKAYYYCSEKNEKNLKIFNKKGLSLEAVFAC